MRDGRLSIELLARFSSPRSRFPISEGMIVILLLDRSIRERLVRSSISGGMIVILLLDRSIRERLVRAPISEGMVVYIVIA